MGKKELILAGTVLPTNVSSTAGAETGNAAKTFTLTESKIVPGEWMKVAECHECHECQRGKEEKRLFYTLFNSEYF